MSELDLAVLRFKDQIKKVDKSQDLKNKWLSMSLQSTAKRELLKRQKSTRR